MYNIKHLYTINFEGPQVFKSPSLPLHSLFNNLTEIHCFLLPLHDSLKAFLLTVNAT